MGLATNTNPLLRPLLVSPESGFIRGTVLVLVIFNGEMKMQCVLLLFVLAKMVIQMRY